MKRIILNILMLTIPVGIYSQAVWEKLPSPVSHNLNAISISGSGKGWIAGNNGTILVNKGKEWVQLPSSTGENLYGISMIDDRNGWAVGAKGTMLYFDGTKWEKTAQLTKNDLLAVSFKDKDHGIAVGKAGTILIFREGRWNAFTNQSRGSYRSVQYTGDEVWIAGGQENISFPMLKLGSIETSPTIYNGFESLAIVNGISFQDVNSGWAVASPSQILYFNGINWNSHPLSNRFPTLTSISFSKDGSGTCVGYKGTLLNFENNEWNREYSGTEQNLRAVTFSENSFYAVGDNGTILRKNLNPSVNELPQAIGNKISFNSYPNPCQDVLNVVVNSTQNLTGNLTITDVYGKLVLNKEIWVESGSLTIPVETSKLKNGLYMMYISVGGVSEVNKFLVIH